MLAFGVAGIPLVIDEVAFLCDVDPCVTQSQKEFPEFIIGCILCLPSPLAGYSPSAIPSYKIHYVISDSSDLY